MIRYRKILLFYLFIIFLYSCTFGDKERTYKKSYKGIIVKNYRDNNNHGMYTFNILNNSYKFEVLSEVWPRCWEYAEIGDSVIKLPDTLMLIVKKPDGREKHFNYDW